MRVKTAPKKNSGFTLIELMVAIGIFGMIVLALGTIYSTSHRHLVQNFRENVVKNSLSVAFKAIQQELSTATRIDDPPDGGSGNTLAYASNISRDLDAATGGCYPIAPSPPAPPAQWGYVCRKAGTNELYLHRGTVAGGAACPDTAVLWTKASYPVAVCGPGGGGKVTLLLDNVDFSGLPCFMRNSAEGESEQVRIRLTIKRPVTTTGRDITATLDTVTKINMSIP